MNHKYFWLRVVTLIGIVLNLFGPMAVMPVYAETIIFTGEELLGRPTDTSITINIVPDDDIEYYYEYGAVSGALDQETGPVTAIGGQPHEVTITGLTPNTRYYYRMVYDGDGDVDDSDYEVRAEHTFHTQRAEEESFVFTVTSDSHGSFDANTATNILNDNPDFHIDLGDTFMIDTLSETQSAYNDRYEQRRSTSYFGGIVQSVPIYLATGNHEEEEGWNLDDTPSRALLNIEARKLYFPMPNDGGFYSASTETLAGLSGDQLRENYYAWEWGDALFVVIDPFQHTMNLPYTPIAGEEGDETVNGDQWSWTLGIDQYTWLKSTLENSDAKYKFVFSHQMVGGVTTPDVSGGPGYVRGGAEAAGYFEWGGYNGSGTWEWDTKRPSAAGWDVPIQQLFVENGVSAYFHGHDHQYVYETRDGVVYQEVPSAGGMGSGFTGIYTEGTFTDFLGEYSTIKQILTGTGHLRISVTPTEATVYYIAAAGGVNYTYTIAPNQTVDPDYFITATAGANGSISPSGSVGVVAGDDRTFNINPNSGYQVADVLVDGVSMGAITTYTFYSVAADHTIEATFVEAPPTGEVTLDGAVSSNTGDDVSSITINHTTGTGTNRLLLVGVSWNCGTTDRTISSVTFTPEGGSAIALDEVITQRGENSSSDPRYSAIYSLLNPPSGVSGTVTVNFSGSVSNGIVAGAANFAGVDQTTPLGTPDGASETSGSSPTLTLTGLSGDELVFDNVFQGASDETQTLTAGVNQTQLWNAWIANARAAASTEEATGNSVTMSWTAASSGVWVIAAVPINPAPVGTTYDLTMASDGNGTTSPTVGVHTYAENVVVSLSATPNTGYVFGSWTGDPDCADGSVTMDADKTCTATFVEAPPTGEVTLDGAVSSATGDDVSSLSFAHTTGTGTNRLLLVGVSWNCGTTDRTISSITFTPEGGSAIALAQVITQLGYNTSNPRYSAIYSLLAPPSGQAGTVTITFSGSVSNGIMAGAANFAGVDQSTPLGTPAGANDNSTTPSVELTGLNGDELVFDHVFLGAGSSSYELTVGSDQTQLWNPAYVANLRAAASTEQATGGSVTMSWTASTGNYWAIAAVPINPAPTTPICYALVLSHTGQGTDPVASPANSIGCPAGEYVKGESISLSDAVPDTGWQISGWTGTIDDSSTASTNTVTMPANMHAVSVVYTEISPICYALTLSHTGNGTDPVASPANSTGCPAGEYVEGESISLSDAVPDMDWQISSWTGTANDSSTADTNSLTMPASAHTASVNYTIIPLVPICVTSRISASSDDAEERNDTGAVDLDGDTSTSSLQMYRTYGGGSTSTLNWWGLRFLNVNVPQGATITSATVTFRANATSGSTASGMTLWGQLATNPDTFAESDDNITNRPRTTVTETWTVPQWTSGSDYATPPLAAIIQEIVDQPGWVANNAMVIIGQTTESQNRRAISYDGTDGETLAPLLEVCYTQAPVGPTISTSGVLSAFSTTPGAPSTAQTYTVSGSNLTADITITAPDGFELSLNDSDWDASLNLSQIGGLVEATTIYVRLYSATEGTFSGDIVHTSEGALARNVAVSGTVTVPSASWIAYNDCAWASGQPDTNITQYTITSGNTTGLLKDYATGQDTPVMVTITPYNNPTVRTGSYGGTEPDAGTDAYDTFHNIVDMAGVIQYGDSGWYVELTFTDLDPDSTYIFAASANRDGSSYTRNSRFTISGVDAATNASTSGVTINNEHSVTFNTGYNTENGYVARWTGINPGADGAFTVRVEADSSTEAYGPSVFMLGLEGEVVTHTLSVSDDGNGSVNLGPAGGTYAAGTTVILTPIANSGFAFSHWSGADASDVIDNGNGTWSIVMDGDKSITANFEVSLCTDVTLDATGDTWLRNSQPARNYGADTQLQANGGSYPQVTLIRWDLTGLPSDATITDASLTLQVLSGGDTAQQFYLYDLLRAWIEGTNDDAEGTGASWTYYDAGVNEWATAGAQGAADRNSTNLWEATTSSFASTGSKTVDLNASGIAVLQSWYNTPTNNNGFTIQNSDASDDYLYISSSETATQPKLNMTYCVPPTGPYIATSGALTPFNTTPGLPSDAQTYTVSGSNLEADINIAAPDGFELSLDGSTWSASLTLPQTGGSVESTQVYVRLTGVEGTFSGNITHESSGATTKNVAVSGTVGWCATVSFQQGAEGYTGAHDVYIRQNDPTYNYGTTTPLMVDSDEPYNSDNDASALLYWDLSSIPAGSTIESASITVYVEDETDSATPGYDLYEMTQAWLEGTGNGSATGDGATWNTYDGDNAWPNGAGGAGDRGSTALANFAATSTGSYQVALNDAGETVLENWINTPVSNMGFMIHAGEEDNGLDFTTKEGSTVANRPKLTIAYCSAPTTPYIAVSGTLDPFASTVGVPSDEQTYTVLGLNLTGDLVITAPADFEISTMSGSGFGPSVSLTPNGEGTVAATTIYVRFFRATTGTSSGNITHISQDATTRNVPVSGIAVSASPEVSLPQPADDATGVPIPLTLEVTVTDPEADTMSVSFYGRPVGTGGGEDFTVFVYPDTQSHVDSASEAVIFNTMSQYVVAKQAEFNVAFATHVGDIVMTANNETEWQRADAAMDILDPAGVPYSVGPGNHDDGGFTGGTTYYPDYFGTSRFSGKPWYGGAYDSDNFNNYSLFSASGMDFIVINLQYNSTSEHWDWADALLKANPGRRGIVAQHNILNVDNSWQSTASQNLYNALQDNPNLFLMLCGHMHSGSDGSAYRLETRTGMDPVHILLTDYQDYNSSGNTGYMRILTFKPATDEIYAQIYSPYVDAYLNSASNYEQFTMAYDMDGSAPFGPLGTVNDVASDANASVTWSDLDEDTEYEWYVDVSDGGSTTTSSTWSFTTGTTLPGHTVTFDANNGTGTMTPQTANAPTALTLNTFERAGYSFSGWNTEANGSGTAYADGVTYDFDVDVTLYAQWTANEYTVSFDANGGSTPAPTSKQVTFDAAYGALATVSRSGYTFDGWFTEETGGTEITADTVVNTAADHTLYAQWTINQYTLSFDSAGGSAVASITQDYGSAITAPDDPTREGYTFAGWNPAVPGTMPAENLTLTAQWTINQYTLSFDSAGGSAVASITQDYGSAINAPDDPTREGYTFAGWNPTVPATMPAENLTLTAQWTANTYTVTFDANGGDTPDPASKQVTFDSTYGALATTSRTGYTFVGWFTAASGGDELTADSIVDTAADHTLYAQWTAIAYTLVANVDPSGGGTVHIDPAAGPYYYNDTVTLTASPAAGYSFAGWSGDVTSTDNPLVITILGNTSLTATFTVLPPDCYALSLSHTGQGTTPVASPLKSDACPANGQYVAGENITLSGATPAIGWYIAGWTGTADDNSTASSNSLTMPASSHAASVNYAIYTFTLQYAAGPGGTLTGDTTQVVNYGASGMPVTATADTGYHFVQWSDGSTANPRTDTNVTANIEVTATFTQEEYTLDVIVDPEAGGAVDVDPQQDTYHYGDVVTLTASAETGWLFAGWSDDLGTGVEITVTITGDTVITATFSEILPDTYDLTIAVDPSGGGTTNPAAGTHTYDEGTVITVTATPTEGYIFDHWSGACTGIGVCEVTMNAHKSVTATFAPITYGVMLVTEEDALSGEPGEIIEYTLTLTNTGNSTDTFVLTFAGNTWDVLLSGTSFALNAGKSARITVSVTIPANAKDGDADAMTVIATSQGNASATASVKLTTTAEESTSEPFRIFLPLVMQNKPG